jgi:hypothetical protein
VFGGMLIGTILGVLVVPSFYAMFQGISEWWQPVPAVAASEGQVEPIQTGD